ncbi:hypothetical protein D3C80_1071670 [compost metagenome]
MAGLASRRARRQMKHAAYDARHQRRLTAEQPPRALGNNVENRLHVGSRHGDDVENLCGDGLAFQRNRKLRLQVGILARCGAQLLLKLVNPALQFDVHG